jgi:hypothetical protein
MALALGSAQNSIPNSAFRTVATGASLPAGRLCPAEFETRSVGVGDRGLG